MTENAEKEYILARTPSSVIINHSSLIKGLSPKMSWVIPAFVNSHLFNIKTYFSTISVTMISFLPYVLALWPEDLELYPAHLAHLVSSTSQDYMAMGSQLGMKPHNIEITHKHLVFKIMSDEHQICSHNFTPRSSRWIMRSKLKKKKHHWLQTDH